MSTEQSENFKGYQPDRSDISKKDVGGKEYSGFTSNHNIEPVTFYPDHAHRGDAPVSTKSREIYILII